MTIARNVIPLFVVLLTALTVAHSKPNIVLLFVDDLGFSDLGYRNPTFESPNISALARESVDFTQFYIPSPACSPSRAGLVTGKHPARLQITRHIPWNAYEPFHYYRDKGDPANVPSRNWLEKKHLTYAEVLKELGYYNLFIGKWHLGHEEYHPVEQGFDRQIGTTNQGNPTSYYPDYFSSSEEFDDESSAYLTDKLTDEAVGFIDSYDRDQPFMLSFWYYSVHTPHMGRDDYVAYFKEKGFGGKRAEYLAMLKSVDDSVGRIRQALERKGIAEDTVILFLSDQGSYFENPPFRGGKLGGTALYEGGARVPFFVRWPGVTLPGENHSLVQSLDIFPTLIEIAGGDPKNYIELDGVSLVDMLRGKSELQRGMPLYGYRSYEDLYASVREGDWKLLAYRSGDLELYNIAEDVGETSNLANKNRAIRESLKAKLIEWEREMGVAEFSGLQEVVEVTVSDFGAFPDDGEDDTRAVKRALEECKKYDLSRLVFEPGQYDFYPLFAGERYLYVSNNDEGLKRIAFDIRDMSHLTLDGHGASLMFHGFINPFVIEESSHVRLENFSIDFSRPFHSEATILNVEKDYMDVEFLEGFPYLIHRGLLYFKDFKDASERMTSVTKLNVYPSSHMLEYDTHKRETAFMVKDYYFVRGGGAYPASRLGERKVRIKVSDLNGTVGNTMVFGPSHRDHPGFVITDSDEISFENVTIHHAGGMGILGQRSHNITVNNCRVTPSSGRINSVTADATHFVNCSGKIELTNNLFENQKDDATNIHGIYQRIIQVTGENSAIVRLMHNQQMGFDYFKPGVEVEFVRGQSLLTFATREIKSANWINKECAEVTFTTPLPDNLEENDTIAEIRDYPHIIITNNIIRNNRARGMLLNGRGRTVVEDNYFHAPGAAILFEGDAFFWFEQGGVNNCIIRNNVFDNCMFGVWGKAVIDVKAGIRENRAESRYNRNILIEDNVFRIFDEVTLLNAYCVDGLVWKGNTIEKTSDYPDRKREAPRFIVEHSDNIFIDELVTE